MFIRLFVLLACSLFSTPLLHANMQAAPYKGEVLFFAFPQEEEHLWHLETEVSIETSLFLAWVSETPSQQIILQTLRQSQELPITLEQHTKNILGDTTKIFLEVVQESSNEAIFFIKDEEAEIRVIMKLVVTPLAVHSLTYCRDTLDTCIEKWLKIVQEARPVSCIRS